MQGLLKPHPTEESLLNSIDKVYDELGGGARGNKPGLALFVLVRRPGVVEILIFSFQTHTRSLSRKVSIAITVLLSSTMAALLKNCHCAASK